MNTPSKEYILGLIAENPNYFDRTLKREYKEWVEQVKVDFKGKIFNESLYQYLHGVDCTKCQTCGNRTKWIGITQGFYQYCSSKCAANNQNTKDLRHATVAALGEEYKNAIVEKRQATMVEKYGVAHALQHAEFREKATDTLISNYGFVGFANPEITNKRNSTILERFGETSPFKVPEIANKRKETNFARYGVATPLLLPDGFRKSAAVRREAATTRIFDQAKDENITPLFDEYTKVTDLHDWQCNVCDVKYKGDMCNYSVPKCPKCHPQTCSKGEGEIREFVKSLGLDFDTNDKKLISPREIDILIPSKKLGIEYHGLYWHSEDKVGENYHLEKLQACNSEGYDLIQVFESEWIENPDLVKERLRAKLGMNSRIFARKCQVIRPSKSEVNEFLNKNHIQGMCLSSDDYGLSIDGNLIAVMTFGKSRYDKAIEWELLRFATRAGFTVVGGASKLLRVFEKEHSPESLISYCDRRWNTGNSYLKLGFSLERTSKPAYHYTNDGVILHNRVKFQKHKLKKVLDLFDEGKTEAQNMADNGYYKVWDCGTNVFTKRY